MAEYRAWYAQALNEDKQFENALEQANAAIRLDPTNGKAFRQRGRAYAGLDKLQEAIDNFTLAIPLDATNADTAYWNRSWLYYRTGKYEEAESDYDWLISFFPKDAHKLAMKGCCAGRLSTPHKPRVAELVSCVKQAIEIDKEALAKQWFAIQLSYLLAQITEDLMSYFSQREDTEVYGNKPVNIGGGLYPQNSSQKLQNDIGGLIAFGLLYGRKINRYHNACTQEFYNNYYSHIIAGLRLAWDLDQDKSVAQNISAIFHKIKGCDFVHAKVAKQFLIDLQPVVTKIKSQFSEFSFS